MTDYLITFFQTLGRLKEIQGCVSHAIDYQDEALFVLISMGDLRARLPLDRLHPDPLQAATDLFNRWKSMDSSERYAVLEGGRG